MWLSLQKRPHFKKKKIKIKKIPTSLPNFFGVVTLNTFLFGPTKHAKNFEKKMAELTYAEFL